MKNIIIFILIFVFSSAKANVLPQSNILIFVSFSMPEDSLKSWLKDASKIGAPVIIRGLVNNSFKNTTQAIYQLVKNGEGGIQIDSLLFERFHIQKVPAVVLTCPIMQTCSDESLIIYGDVPLDYILRKIASKHTAFSPVAEIALKQLKEASHV